MVIPRAATAAALPIFASATRAAANEVLLRRAQTDPVASRFNHRASGTRKLAHGYR
jgi:hypothetical protein